MPIFYAKIKLYFIQQITLVHIKYGILITLLINNLIDLIFLIILLGLIPDI